MSDKDIEPCGVWDSDFSWDGYFLRMHMKTVTQQYDMYNPRTWPLVSQVMATENNSDYRKSKVPPEYLVYEQTLIKDLDALRPLQAQRTLNRRKNRGMKNLFRYYPLNYDRNGELRAHPHIPADELEEWLNQVCRSVPTTTEEVDTKDVVYDDHANESLPKDSYLEACPDAAYDAIMKTLVDSGPASIATVARLEEELSCARKNFQEMRKNSVTKYDELAKKTQHHQNVLLKYAAYLSKGRKELTRTGKALSEEKAKVTKLESDLESCLASNIRLQDRYDALEREYARSQAMMDGLSQNLQHRTSEVASKIGEIKGLDSVVKKLTADLAVANQETTAEKQRIVKIWKELKKVQESSSQKNKATEDVSETQRKKLKSEA